MNTQDSKAQITVLRGHAKARHDHARECKKPIDTCKQCQASIAWFAGLPLATLSLVLEEKPA